ncbi:MAG: hypothetical protein H0T84_02275 [Tatlockia sp.]|nr:hypothetical protein [Tatlockia sp.]
MGSKFKIRPFEEIINGTVKEDGYIQNQDGFNQAKGILSGEHHKEVTDELEQPRRHQVQFIEKSVELMSFDLMSNEKDKAKTLTSLMVLVMCVIGRTYSPGILKATSAENIYQALDENSATRNGNLGKGSTYFRSLLKSIGYSEKNKLEPEDIIELLTTAKGFIESQIYVDGDSAKGLIIDHPYADIAQLDIIAYLKTAITELYESELKILDRNSDQLKQNKEVAEKSRQEEAIRIDEPEQAFTGGPGGIIYSIGRSFYGFIAKEEKTGLNESDLLETTIIHEDIAQDNATHPVYTGC